VADYSPTFDFPFTSVQVHVGPADASCFELHENLPARNTRFRDVFNLYVVRAFVNSGFQEKVAFQMISKSAVHY
jgi:hypothetical protein